MSELLASPESAEKARKAFKLMDRNGDDLLDRAEWKEFGMLLLKRAEHHKEATPASKSFGNLPDPSLASPCPRPFSPVYLFLSSRSKKLKNYPSINWMAFTMRET